MALKKRKANTYSTKGKKAAWKKGQSCSYNPKCTKFRDEVKKRTFGYGGANSNLTQDALAQHNVLSNAVAAMNVDADTDKTSDTNTFVSSFSNCSKPCFNRLLKRWHSNSALHKEMLAVLAAVTEVIKERGGKETETEYFAALMTTLDVVENNEAKTAVLSLLYMVVKRLPPSLLKVNFEKTCPVLKDLLIKYMESDYNAFLRNLVGCIYFFLKTQDSPSWKDTTKDVYNTLLEYALHHKPKVRKCSQEAISSLLKAYGSENVDAPVHPAAHATGQFCIEKLEIAVSSQSTGVFHVLNLLRHVIGNFPRSSLKLCCENILRIMTLGSAMVITNCLKALHGLFELQPKPGNLPDELNVRIIKALYDYQPNVNDSEPLISWLLVMESAFVNLYRLNSSMCINHLPKFCKVAVNCWLSDRDDVLPVVASTLKNIIYSCLVPSDATFQQLMLNDPIGNPMHKMFNLVEAALSYQYFRAWKHVLIVLTAFFDVIGKHSYTVMLTCLQSLADLRDSFKFPHIAELDKAVGVAVHRMGPEAVLNAVPLQITGENDKLDFPRSWLLPVMRDNVKETELSFFIRYFLPLVSRLRKKVMDCEKENKAVESKTYDVICSQIWSLLPGFCTLPTDLQQSFKTIARILGITLNEQPTLRVTILKSLRILISKNLENGENKAELGKFAKNFLPILFNLYTTESKDKSEEFIRLAVFDTIKIYLQITDKELCRNFFVRVMGKLKEPTSFTQSALLDLGRAMLPYLEEGQIRELYEYCKPLLQDSNHTIQKKSYGVVNEICSAETETCLSFVKINIGDLKTTLLTSLSKSAAPSKARRLSCLQHIICHLSEDNKGFIVAVVPEATVCTKETAVKARRVAFKLLAEIGNTLKKWKPDDPKGALRDYMQMLLAGLAGGSHMMSAAILAIGHVIYEFKDDLDSDLIHMLIENACLLLTSKSREVVTSSLSFMKILFATVSTMDLIQHAEFLVTSIASISEDNQRHFRYKAKEVFTRLIRKFGYEMISKMAPEKFQKQLINIRKTESRKKKKQRAMQSDYVDTSSSQMETKEKSDLIDDILKDSSDEEDEDTINPRQHPKRKLKSNLRKKTGLAWIAESSEKEIVDFMDPAVNRKILATNPTDVTKKKKKTVRFDMTEDGRIIIPDEKMEKAQTRKRQLEDISVDDSDEDMSSSTAKRKRQKDDDLSDDGQESSKSRAVLKGIHRTMSKSKNAPGAEFKAKKAGGDVKKGKIDPYAYIPLNKQALNKRKQKKLAGQFKGIIRAAKKGAQKGSKRKSKNVKRRR